MLKKNLTYSLVAGFVIVVTPVEGRDENQVMLNDASVLTPDIEASNGVLDQVILPPDLEMESMNFFD